ncbi:MAG: serine hydrolase domain-containing protein [Calditrichia bacterium]
MLIRPFLSFLIGAILLLTLPWCSQNNQNTANGNLWKANRATFQQDNPNFASTFEAKVSDIFTQNMLQGDFLLAVVNKDGLAYSFALNNDILNNKPSALSEDSPIYIASHSKAFTGTLLKKMEEDGVIDLSKSLHHYLPELTYGDSIDTKKIAVRQLLNHTHGTNSIALIFKTAFLGYKGGRSELIHDLNTHFRHDPSHQFRYSNTGSVLAGIVVDKLTGNSWKDEMKERVFLPLQMNNTSSNVSDFTRKDIRPNIRVAQNNKIVQSGFFKEDITMNPSGGTLSTLSDLSKWLHANINQSPILFKSAAAWKEMHEPTVSQDRTYFTYKRHGYSLGWDIATYQSDTLLTRFGGFAGISFHASFFPGRKTGIVAFSNDPRATRLTHIAANYAYNLLNESLDAETIFATEMQQFDEVFERNKKRFQPAEKDIIPTSNENDALLGNYKNDSGWPAIIIDKQEETYRMTWGIQSGVIYKSADPDAPFVGMLGAITRHFRVEKDSLFTGSLHYKKM